MSNEGKICAGLLLFLVLSAVGSGAALSAGENADAAGSRGIYIAVPAYLYGENSSCGLQAGYQFEKMHVRMDLNVSEAYRYDEAVWFFMPSVGVFWSQTFGSGIRFYEGLTVGVEKGMLHSFDGVIGFVNYIAGVEFLSSGNRAFFVEIGSGTSFANETGAYNGGTIVGGGFKYYFDGKKNDKEKTN